MKVDICTKCGRDFWSTNTDDGICFSCSHVPEEKPKKKQRTFLGISFRKPKKKTIEPVKEVHKNTTVTTEESYETKVFFSDKNHGYVYLMRSGNGYYKIGMTKDVDQRTRGLRRQFPILIEVVRTIACYDRRKVEKILHRKFNHKRIEYEWFNLDDVDVDWFMNVRNFELG